MTTAARSAHQPMIEMQGVLRFRFPRGASLVVRKAVIARFVRETQARIDEEEELERQMAAFRARGKGKGSVTRLQRCAFTYAEAAEQMGITESEVARAVSIGLLLSGSVGYVPHISDTEIRRFKAERAEAA